MQLSWSVLVRGAWSLETAEAHSVTVTLATQSHEDKKSAAHWQASSSLQQHLSLIIFMKRGINRKTECARMFECVHALIYF